MCIFYTILHVYYNSIINTLLTGKPNAVVSAQSYQHSLAWRCAEIVTSHTPGDPTYMYMRKGAFNI